jgi:hypothetical protein
VTATYLYAVCRPVDEDGVADLRGVSGAAVRTLREGELCLAVSDVPLEDFDTDALQQHLEDFTWLTRTAREHDDVVSGLAERTTTAPLRMATVCRDDASARAKLAALADAATAVLDRLDGRIEWGVKVYARVPETADERSGSGAEYLRRRRAALRTRQQELATAQAQATSAYETLLHHAAAGRRHEPQDSRLTGVAAPMLLNAAFLVDTARVAEFRTAVEQVGATADALEIVLTGPWPPYSFAVLDES